MFSKISAANTSKLVREIATKADDVFLWVKLVVVSLLRGLQNKDNDSDLQKRLMELPNDLSALYEIMIHESSLYTGKKLQRFFRSSPQWLRSKVQP